LWQLPGPQEEKLANIQKKSGNLFRLFEFVFQARLVARPTRWNSGQYPNYMGISSEKYTAGQEFFLAIFEG
jgi:hypothetical protein